MTNPYDQFYEPTPGPSTNPYDQFYEPAPTPKPTPKAPVKPAAPAKPATPKKDDPSWREVGRGFVRNLGQGAKEFATTVRDAYRRPLVDNAYLMATGAMDTTEAAKELMKSPEKAWQVLKAAGGVYATRYGTLDGFKRDLRDHPYQMLTDLVTVLTLPVPGAAGATVGGKAAQATNAMVSKVAPSVAAAARSTPGVVKYAAKAAVAPTHVINDAASLVPKAARYTEGIRNPMNRFVGNVTGGKDREMLNALAKGKKEIVPGSKPTAAQVVSQSMPATRLAAAERTAQRWLSDEAAGAMNAQNTARLSHFDEIAPLPGGGKLPLDQRVKTMEQIREQNKAKYYGMSDPVLSQSNDRLFEILNLVEADSDLLARARRLAKRQEGQFGTGPYVPGQWVPDPYGQNLPPVWQPPQYPSYTGAELDFIKKAFDEIAFERRNNTAKPATRQEIEAIRDARNKFLNWIENDGGNPHYSVARAKYAEDSKLLNQMEVARMLRAKLTNKPAGEDALKLQAQQFRAALDSPLNEALGNKNIRQATGDMRYQSIRELLGDDQYQALVRIADDLDRQALTDQYATQGMKHAGDIETMLSDALHVDPNNRFVKPFVNWKNEQLATKAANARATPEGLENLILNRLARESEIASLNSKVNAFVTPYRVMNRYPALYNVLMAPQQEQQPSNAFAR